MKKIFIASDHAGFELKEKIKAFLESQNYEVKDFGAFEFNEEDDYPDFIIPVAREISQATIKTDASKNPFARAIILGGSGQGEAICANRFKGVRAVVYYGGPIDIVKLSREHNDSNILSLGARFLSEDEAVEAVRVWLTTSFEGGRHQRRIKKVS